MENRYQFDFDQWSALFRSDPQAFEMQRTAVLDDVCHQMEARHIPSIANIRWRIDMERARSHSPLQCCLRVSELMWEKFLDLNEVLQNGELAPRQSEIGQVMHLGRFIGD